MKLDMPLENIIHAHFTWHRTMAESFIRFHAYYEYPGFRDKAFSQADVEAWFLANDPPALKDYRLSYYHAWGGYAATSETLAPFYEGRFDPLSRMETRLLSKVSMLPINSRFCIIGTSGCKQNPDYPVYYKHEMAHALYFINPVYNSEVIGALNGIPSTQREIMNTILTENGYYSHVFEEETHAYLISGQEIFNCDQFSIESLEAAHNKLNAIFLSHTKGLFK
jgi:hypothetical protein